MPRALDGKSVVLGVSGGIAAYKAADLTRRLVEAGATVRVVMTAAAREFIAPLTLQTLSGQPVATDTFDLTQESEIGHIRLADSADVVVVAPATANVLGKLAAGIADDLLTTVLLATRAPVLLAPAMNVHMYENRVVQANVARLRDLGMRVVEPAVGELACGYSGAGRLPETQLLVAEVERAAVDHDLAGERVLVTAGPTREAIDPVRFLSNRSTGKMGFAVAAAAWRRGADVTLVAGPTHLPTPHGVRRVNVTTAAEMYAAANAEFSSCTVLLMVAAVADYRAAHVATSKLKKTEGGISLELERTVDILASFSRRKGSRTLVGFAAETDDVTANAEKKLAGKKLDLVVANDVGRADAGFAVDTNAVTLIGRGGERTDLPLLPKSAVADAILDRVVALRASAGSAPPRRAATRPRRRSGRAAGR